MKMNIEFIAPNRPSLIAQIRGVADELEGLEAQAELFEQESTGMPPKNKKVANKKMTAAAPVVEEEEETDDIDMSELGDEEENDDVDLAVEEKVQAAKPAKAAIGLESHIIPAFQKYAKKYDREKAAKVLAKYKVKSVRDIPEAKYGEVLKVLGA